MCGYKLFENKYYQVTTTQSTLWPKSPSLQRMFVSWLCDQIELFLKGLGDKYTPKIWQLFELFWKMLLLANGKMHCYIWSHCQVGSGSVDLSFGSNSEHLKFESGHNEQ